MEHASARRLAENIVKSLAPACSRIAIAGSIRRGKREVKDVEIVAIPQRESLQNLFGESVDSFSKLDPLLADLIREGRLAWDVEVRRNGEKHKRLKIPRYDMVLDLFLADENNWGNIFAIRTGDFEFSHLLVTSRAQGGCMPVTLRQEGGYLWSGLSRIDCPTEEDYFAALGIKEVPPPEFRSREMALNLARKVKER